MKDLIILGAGENGIMVAYIIVHRNSENSRYNIIGFLDDDENKIGTKIAGIPVMGKMNTWKEYKNAVFTSPLVSSPKKNHLKKAIVERLGIESNNFINIIPPTINYFGFTSVGKGNLLLTGSQFQPNVNIGSHIYVSNNSVICSNAIIEDYVNISNSVSIMGGVHINHGAYLGANSSIIGYTSVGKWSIIGMGSVVVKAVEDYEIVAGNPAKVIGENKAAKEYME